MVNRWRCDECETFIVDSEILTAPNPFDPEDTIVGCPHCKAVGQFTNICDEVACNEIAGCGWPSPEGYRRTCFKHMEREV